MKGIWALVLLVFFAAQGLLANTPQIRVQVRMVDEKTRKALPFSTVEILQDGLPFSVLTGNQDGHFEPVTLPLNHYYLLYFRQTNYVTKSIEIVAFCKKPELLPGTVLLDYEMPLFVNHYGTFFRFLPALPVAIFKFNAAGALVSDPKYTSDIQRRIEQVKKERENKPRKQPAEEANPLSTNPKKALAVLPNRDQD